MADRVGGEGCIILEWKTSESKISVRKNPESVPMMMNRYIIFMLCIFKFIVLRVINTRYSAIIKLTPIRYLLINKFYSSLNSLLNLKKFYITYSYNNFGCIVVIGKVWCLKIWNFQQLPIRLNLNYFLNTLTILKNLQVSYYLQTF